MSSPHPPLTPTFDPFSLGRLQVLLIPVHTTSSPLSQQLWTQWTSLIRSHTSLSADDLHRRPAFPSLGHTRSTPTPGSGERSTHVLPRDRFFHSSSSATGGSGSGSVARISAPRTAVRLSYPARPPARHLYPLSLLRIAEFPLVVIGIAVDGEEADLSEGYEVDPPASAGAQAEAQDPAGTPTASTFSKASLQGTETPAESAFRTAVGELFPQDSPYPLAKRLMVVPPHPPGIGPAVNGSSSKAGGRGLPERGFTVRAPPNGADEWVISVLGGAVAEVLEELGELISSLETPAGLKSLSSTLLPTLSPAVTQTEHTSHPHSPLPADLPRRASTATPTIPSLPSTHPPLPSQSLEAGPSSFGASVRRAITPGGRPTSVGPAAPAPLPSSLPSGAPANPPPAPAASSNPFRRSTANISSPFSRAPSAASMSSTASAPAASATSNTMSKFTSAPLSGVAGGRLVKLIGDVLLLMGNHGDAIRCYDDGAERARSVGDVLWEALAREGRAVAGIGEAWEARDGSHTAQPFPSSPIPVEILTHYLSALSCLARAPLPYPPTILSPSPHAVSGSLSMAPSLISTTTSIGTGEGLLAYLYSSLCVRIAHFSLLIWASGGWGSMSLSSLLAHSLPRSFPAAPSDVEIRDSTSRRKRHHVLHVLSTKSQVSRQSVMAHAEQAVGPHCRALTKTEQLVLHVELVWLARWLDLARKEANASREVLKRLTGMILAAREESRRLQGGPERSHAVQAHSLQAQQDAAAVGLGLGMTVASSPNVAVRRKESTEGNAALMATFDRVAYIMGVDLLSSSSTATAIRSPRLPDDLYTVAPRFGWPELQVEFLKEGIAMAEALPDHLGVIRLTTSALHSLHRYLNPQSQGVLSRMYPKALATVRRRGIEYPGLGWWVPGEVVLSMEVASLAANRMPVEHAPSELLVEQKGKKDPFLYNPRSKAAQADKILLVANEQIDVFVTLKNPLAFELDIQDLSLITAGTAFTSNPLAIVIPPLAVQTVRLTGLAGTPGRLELKGVSVRLADGSQTEILLPKLSEKDQQKRDKRKSRLTSDLAKTKKQGLDARSNASEAPDGPPEDDGSHRWLECNVVQQQPLLWIKGSSLTHGTMMLYDGECATLRIILENSSSSPVNFIKLSFDDSTARAAQAALAEPDVPPAISYELDWDNLHRPVFHWDNEGQMSIPPGGRSSLVIRCLGKVGCTDGSIRIDYGHVPSSNANQALYTRQITFPILFTVYNMFDMHDLDLVRLSPSGLAPDGPRSNGGPFHDDWNSARKPSLAPLQNSRSRRASSFGLHAEDLLMTVLREESNADHCLVDLSVSNVYGVPFEVCLSRTLDDDEEPVTTSRLIPPGATESLMMPLPRFSLTAEEATRPIPSLIERQYIVDKSGRTMQQVDAEKELFWYREKLLSMLSLSWSDPSSQRVGQISLRRLYLAPQLLDILRTGQVDISLSISSEAAVTAMDFVSISCRVCNKLERPLRPSINIVPLPSSALDSSWAASNPPSSATNKRQSLLPAGGRNVAFDGSLTHVLPLLQPGEGAEHTVGVCFLAAGKYAFRAAVEDIALDQSSESQISPPRIWFSDTLHVAVSA